MCEDQAADSGVAQANGIQKKASSLEGSLKSAQIDQLPLQEGFTDKLVQPMLVVFHQANPSQWAVCCLNCMQRAVIQSVLHLTSVTSAQRQALSRANLKCTEQ